MRMILAVIAAAAAFTAAGARAETSYPDAGATAGLDLSYSGELPSLPDTETPALGGVLRPSPTPTSEPLTAALDPGTGPAAEITYRMQENGSEEARLTFSGAIDRKNNVPTGAFMGLKVGVPIIVPKTTSRPVQEPPAPEPPKPDVTVSSTGKVRKKDSLPTPPDCHGRKVSGLIPKCAPVSRY